MKVLLRVVIFVVAYQFFSYLFWGQFQLNSHFLYQGGRNQSFNFVVVPQAQWDKITDVQELIRKQFKTIYHALDEVPTKNKVVKNDQVVALQGGCIYTRNATSSLFKRAIDETQWVSSKGAEYRKDNYYFILGFWIKINDSIQVS